MQSFPENFNFTESNKIFDKKVTEEDLGRYREEIYNKWNNALADKKEYFIINLEDINSSARNVLLRELLDNFPYIGAKSNSIDPDNIMQIFAPLRYQQRSTIRISKENTYYDSELFVIALTKQFGKVMESYWWKGDDKVYTPIMEIETNKIPEQYVVVATYPCDCCKYNTVDVYGPYSDKNSAYKASIEINNKYNREHDNDFDMIITYVELVQILL